VLVPVPPPAIPDNCRMLMQPSPQDVRRFFCGAYQRWRDNAPQDALQTMAALWIADHPEYHAELADLPGALARIGQADEGRQNPFLHLSMHLSISEQCSIDQPRGIRQAVELLAHRRGDLHAAHHEVMECLGQMLADAQSRQRPPDGDAYVACVQRRATRDGI
jgi:hypothetical protein